MPTRYLLFVALTLLFTGFVAYNAYRTAQLLKSWRPDRNLLLHPVENALRLLMIALCYGLGILSGLSREQLGWVWGDIQQQVLMGLLWGSALATLFFFSTRWLASLISTHNAGDRLYSSIVAEAIVPNTKGEFVGVLLMMSLVVLFEELLFRSLLVGGLAVFIPATLLVVLTAGLFGIMHLPQGIWGITGATLAGILFGALFLQSGSLVLPCVAHYIANMLQIGLAMHTRNPA